MSMTGIPDERCEVEKKKKPTVEQTIDELARFQRLLGRQAFVDYKTSQLMGVAIELLNEQEKEISRISNEYLKVVKTASKQPQVVRCKDCRWGWFLESGKYTCKMLVSGWHNPDWFCADGKHR